MSYAIRNDRQGWRAIAGEQDVGANEYFSEVPVDIVQIASVPEKVTMRQARLSLLQSGLLSQVEDEIEALPEPQRSAARIEWDYASEVFRGKEFVLMLGAALSLTDEQIDDLFITAATF